MEIPIRIQTLTAPNRVRQKHISIKRLRDLNQIILIRQGLFEMGDSTEFAVLWGTLTIKLKIHTTPNFLS
jgi:hypothetical protein